MFVRQTTSWHYSLGFDYGIDFAFWILEQDGLLVPPFDKHMPSTPDAGILESFDGIPHAPPDTWHFPVSSFLQPLGFNQNNWWIWFNRIVLDTVEDHIRVRTDPYPTGRVSLLDPASLYPGSDALRDALRDRYRDYLDTVGNQRKTIEQAVMGFRQNNPKYGRNQWRAMSSTRGELPPVQYFMVAYPFHIVHAVPPSSVILAFGSSLPSEIGFQNMLLDGLQQLQD